MRNSTKLPPAITDPPHDHDAERKLLASILLDPSTLSRVNLTPAEFFNLAHAQVFGAMQAVAGEGATPDHTLIVHRLKRLPAEQARCLGTRPAALLLEIVKAECTAANVVYYADIVRDKAAARQQQAQALATLAAIQRGEPVDGKRNGVPLASGKAPVLVNLADVTPRAVRWLWPGRIALGKLTLIAGEPGQGKSFLTMDIAARVTTGNPWPNDPSGFNQAGSVVLLAAEDDLEDTVRTRLDAAGALVQHVTALQGIEFRADDAGPAKQRCFNLEHDLPALEHAIESSPDCRLVIIDPVSEYLGRTDSHKNAEVRGLLAPLRNLAAQRNVAVVVVTHLNKAAGTKAMSRVTGSLAFIAAARAGWLVVADKANPKRRLLLPIKNNLAEDVGGLAYSIIDGALAWERGSVSLSADDALAEEPRKDGHTERDDAADWLRELLADGPMAQRDVAENARANGISTATLRRAKVKAGVESRKHGNGKDARWTWALPGQDDTPQRSKDAEDAHPSDVSAFDTVGAGEHFPGDDQDDRGEP